MALGRGTLVAQMSHGSRHLFVQRATAQRLFERDLRAEHEESEHGYVTEAQYFEVARGVRGWAQRLREWFGGAQGEGGARVKLVPPFDAQGADRFGYFSGALPPKLDGVDDPPASIRLARGTIVSLSPRSPGDDVVLRDYWACDGPAWRLTDMIDFGLQTASRTPLAICCAQCPLVLAEPETGVFDDELSALDPQAATLCDLESLAWRGRSVSKCTLRVGDVIEALGVVWSPERCRARFDVIGRGGPFRSAGVQPISLVLGDERGTRMVLRKVRG